MQEGFVSFQAITYVYHMQDSNVWFELGWLFGFWPFILLYIIQTKCFSCKKVWCHLMQSDKCIKWKIVKWDLAFNHCLGFDHLFWPISFKSSAYHAKLQVHHMHENTVWLGLESLFRFWPIILAYINQTKCLSCKKGRYHLMQCDKGITCKIVMCDYSWITIWASISIWVSIIYFGMYNFHEAGKDSYTCQG